MQQTVARNDLDQVIWVDYVRMRDQREVAAKHGISQSAVSRAVARYLASIPPEEKREIRVRSFDRLEELYQAHRERALTSVKAATLIDKVVMDQARLFGAIPKEVQHSGTVEHEHTLRTPPPGPVESTDQVLARMLAARGAPIPAELVRLDQSMDGQSPAVQEADR